ncbi:c-type cytochrome [Ramlibacter sp. Leaf400]|uniref:c-type cytochrome n=1 Tax=Ramlibacter sp. Leaf400 TaxID=1736365 RepID=UPI0006F671E3|nr:c-type cytochrome [Ramlibacter sp. Leaf400]KQT09307.1 hypothetical protein ASG30_12035 [Ramlibacter sp. Leaf400]
MHRPDSSSRRRGRWPALLLAAFACACSDAPQPPHVPGGDASRGRAAIERYGCVACHTIPGLPAHGANVGPPLVNLAERGYLGGVLPNTPQQLVRWLQDPPAVAPRTVMPNLGVSAAEAADIAAYLYSH